MNPVGIGFADPVTPRHNPEAAAQAPHFIEIESQFDRAVARSPPVAVRMPGRVAGEIVAVTGHVVEIIAQEGGPDAFYAFVVEQRAQIRMPVNKGEQGRIPLVVVRALVVAAPVLRPHRLEGLGNGFGFAGKEAGKVQIAEQLEEAGFLFRHRGHEKSSNSVISISWIGRRRLLIHNRSRPRKHRAPRGPGHADNQGPPLPRSGS